MKELDQLAQLAALAAQIRQTDIGQLRNWAKQHDKWHAEDGFRYAPFPVRDIRALFIPFIDEHGPSAIEKFEIDIVDVVDGLRPHRHIHSDNAVVCAPNTAGLDGYFDFGEAPSGAWVPMAPRQIVPIPRRLVHGFRRAKNNPMPLSLISISFPPIRDDDTLYRDNP